MSDDTTTTGRISRFCDYADLFDRLLDVAVLVDVDQYRIVDCNDSAERLLGVSRGELRGKGFLDLLTPESKETAERSLRMAKRRYHPRAFEAAMMDPKDPLRMLRMDVSACVLKTVKPTGSGAEIYVVQIILRDVTAIFEAKRKLEELSLTDELTGLYNVRHFRKEFAKEHERADRYNTPYSIVFCDVDHFKKFNDTYGHAAGDVVLKKVGELVMDSCRNTDLPARYGGEEFVVLCPGVSWQGATVLAERIRHAIESYAFQIPDPVRVTMSLGVASFPEHGSDAEGLLKAADAALYDAKHAGRNRCMVSTVKSLNLVGIKNQNKKDSGSNSSTHQAPSRPSKKSG